MVQLAKRHHADGNDHQHSILGKSRNDHACHLVSFGMTHSLITGSGLFLSFYEQPDPRWAVLDDVPEKHWSEQIDLTGQGGSVGDCGARATGRGLSGLAQKVARG